MDLYIDSYGKDELLSIDIIFYMFRVNNKTAKSLL